jgi:glycosyltransferase involved in cell wall biosynthesis
MMPTIKILSVIEATTVTGPAKNLLNFARLARTPQPHQPGLPRVEVSIVTFHRLGDSEENGRRRQPFDSPPNSFVAAAREEGVDVDMIPERFRFDPRVIRELRAIVERRAPDIIQTHAVKSHFLLRLSGLWRQHPWIAFHHGYTATNRRMVLYNWLNRWSLPFAHRVVTVCQAFADQLASEGVSPENISVLHNSINANGASNQDADLHQLKERLGVDGSQRVVLAVGRFSREKGHADLINALGALHRVNPDLNFRLVLVGDGPERRGIERAAETQGIAPRVIFAGHVGNVRPFYKLADALVLPSHSEGSPNVLLEAMAAGLPVVATAVGGVPEMVENEESALLVASGNTHAMASAIGRVLTDEMLAHRLAASASSLVATRYSPEAYARSVTEIYCDLRNNWGTN